MKKVMSSLTVSIQRCRHLVTRSRICEFAEDKDYFLLSIMFELGDRLKMDIKNIHILLPYIKYMSMTNLITIILFADL